ncbi:uncharacterized protein SAPINGB_P001806 [Magnusiomyces paraingens]|uniref:Uncharacterized protein n=1 Tax=Magnusiomyces paraingens TaxID=2606893 RepID=A0A5E8BGC0_9ASCO|nr:uncharacterized protein SAPINGB_P001806 [Saprochaete ingens]VVT48492.1 unnamed protein product [Saprochaete ingens]
MSIQESHTDLEVDTVTATTSTNNDIPTPIHATALKSQQQDKPKNQQSPESISQDSLKEISSIDINNHTAESRNTPELTNQKQSNELPDPELRIVTKPIQTLENQNIISLQPKPQEQHLDSPSSLPNSLRKSESNSKTQKELDSLQPPESKQENIELETNTDAEAKQIQQDDANQDNSQTSSFGENDLPAGKEQNGTYNTEGATKSPSEELKQTLPESIRYSRLVQITELSVTETIKRLNYKELATCYPTIASTTSGEYALQQALTQIQNFFENAALREFETIYEERNIAYLFHELEILIKEAYERKDKSEKLLKEAQEKGIKDPPKLTGPDAPLFLQSLAPETIVSAHIVPYQQSKIAELKEQLSNLRRSNQQALNTLNSSNDKAQTILSNIQDMAKDLATKTKPISAAKLPSNKEIAKAVNSLPFDNDLLL